MYDYFEEKKRRGLIFTLHNIDPNLPYDSIDKKTGRPIESPGEATWWSHLSSRYRDADEQKAFIESGCVDKRLPPKEVRYAT